MSQQPKTLTNVQQIDPTVAPYVDYGLRTAKTYFENPQTYFPEYYPGQTYVSPSQSTEAARLALQNRAMQGSALKPAATEQQLKTIGGDYLAAGNPYLASALQPGFTQATNAYNQAVNQALSGASRAGRYGSGAMNTALTSAGQTLATGLAGQAGQLGYQAYENERARQQAAAQMYPQMAAADYADIGQLAQAGQIQESYEQQRLQDALNRYNYTQNIPQQNLQQYMGYVYGAPMGQVQSSQVYRNPMSGVLGGGMLGASIPGATTGTALGGAALGGLLGLL